MKSRLPDRDLDSQPDELFADADFRWKVADAGYRWERLRWIPFGSPRGIEDEDWLLTDGVLFGAKFDVHQYLPLKEIELYRKFAELKSNDKDAIRAFAKQYGKLGVTVQAVFPIPESRQKHPSAIRVMDEESGKPVPIGELGTGERFVAWTDAIDAMRRALQLHRLIVRGRTTDLKKLVQHRKGEWLYQSEDKRCSSLIQTRELDIPPDNALLAARICLQRWINDRLAENCAPQLLWDVQLERQVFRIMPKVLLGALWLQFARVVVGDVSYRPCKACGRLLTISTEHGGFRADREFCGPACRQKDHRRKVRDAKELQQQGKSNREIAKHFDTSVDTIKGWLSKE
jgi:hypothetical protein